MSEVWAKLLEHEKHGQILVTKDFDDEQDLDTVVLEVRGKAVLQVKLSFPFEHMRDKAFDQIVQDNVEEVMKGGTSVLAKLEGE